MSSCVLVASDGRTPEPFGAEFAEVQIESDRLATRGVRRARSGTWEEAWNEDGVGRVLGLPGPTDLDVLAGALDVDLGLSPLLNTPPVFRHSLLQGNGTWTS